MDLFSRGPAGSMSLTTDNPLDMPNKLARNVSTLTYGNQSSKTVYGVDLVSRGPEKFTYLVQ